LFTYLLAFPCVLASPILFSFASTKIGVLETATREKESKGHECCAFISRVEHANPLRCGAAYVCAVASVSLYHVSTLFFYCLARVGVVFIVALLVMGL
jgi:hypothetical protein